MLTCKDVAEILHVSRQTAMRLMRQQMRTINVGASAQNPRLIVTREELNAWIQRSAKVQEPPALERRKKA